MEKSNICRLLLSAISRENILINRFTVTVNVVHLMSDVIMICCVFGDEDVNLVYCIVRFLLLTNSISWFLLILLLLFSYS